MNIPVPALGGELNAYDAARDCPDGNCVVEKIKAFAIELSDRQMPERRRLEALKFLVHFIADLHQPLHASNHNDRGGNSVMVVFFNRPTNLHAVWDTEIIQRAVGADERSYALRLVRDTTPDELAAWSKGDPASWANESYQIAVEKIYGEWPPDGALAGRYENAALPIVDQQLEKAGVRLAAALNAAFR